MLRIFHVSMFSLVAFILAVIAPVSALGTSSVCRDEFWLAPAEDAAPTNTSLWIDQLWTPHDIDGDPAHHFKIVSPEGESVEFETRKLRFLLASGPRDEVIALSPSNHLAPDTHYQLQQHSALGWNVIFEFVTAAKVDDDPPAPVADARALLDDRGHRRTLAFDFDYELDEGTAIVAQLADGEPPENVSELGEVLWIGVEESVKFSNLGDCAVDLDQLDKDSSFRVAAIDAAGNLSAWTVVSPTLASGCRQSNESSVAWVLLLVVMGRRRLIRARSRACCG